MIPTDKTKEIVSRIEKVLEAETEDFISLISLSGLNPLQDLAGADLEGINLRNANLENSDLKNSFFKNADLRDANLQCADLSGADFSGAKLVNAKLMNANLSNARFTNADMRNADITGANIKNADFKKAINFVKDNHFKSKKKLEPGKAIRSRKIVKNHKTWLTIKARDDWGFFGLNELNGFFTEILEKIIKEDVSPTFVLDFSNIKVWDISALLWLIVALYYYGKSKEFKYFLKLPESTSGMTEYEAANFDRSADYLRRWRFDSALCNLDPDVKQLLVPEQSNYFSNGGPQKYYTSKQIVGQDGHLQQLLSLRLVEIVNFADSEKKIVIKDKISNYFEMTKSVDICEVITNILDVEKDSAKFFSKYLLFESLSNVLEHPNASIGMVSMSMLSNDLILVIADNGDEIPATIYPHFLNIKEDTYNLQIDLPYVYPRRKFNPELRAQILSHATQPGVSRNLFSDYSDPNNIFEPRRLGLGLTLLRNHTTGKDNFRGELTILSEGVGVKYNQPTNGNKRGFKSFRNLDYPWKGNLLRIRLPVAKQKRHHKNYF